MSEKKPWEEYASDTVDVPQPPWTTYQNKPEGPSSLEIGSRGFVQGVALDFADEAAAKAISLVTGKPYEQAVNEIRKGFKKSQEADPLLYGASKVGGAVAGMFTPMGATGRLAAGGGKLVGAAGRILEGGLLSGVQAVGESEETDRSKLMEQAEGGAKVGAGVGAGVEAVVAGLPYAGRPIAKGLRDFADWRYTQGLGAERGTLKKAGTEKAQNVGRWARDVGIIGEGGISTPAMTEKNKIQLNLAGKKIGEILNTIDSTGKKHINALEMASAVDEKIGDFWRDPIHGKETSLYNNLMESFLHKGEYITANEAQNLKLKIGKLANYNRPKDQAVTQQEQMARDAYEIVKDYINQSAEKAAQEVGGTSLAKELQDANRIYTNASTAKGFLINRQAREAGNKMTFGLTDTIALGSAVGAAALSGTDPLTSLAIGAGTLGAKRGMERFGNQVAGMGADALSTLIRTNPGKMGPYASGLVQSLSRGSQSLAVQHYIMSQKDPNYVEAVRQALEDDEKKKIESPRYGGLGADIGNMIDNVTWSDKVGLDPQEQEQSGFQYGEGVPQPASVKPPIMKFFKNDKLTEGRPILEVFKKLMAQEADGTISTVGKLQLEKLRKQYKAPIVLQQQTKNRFNWDDDYSTDDLMDAIDHYNLMANRSMSRGIKDASYIESVEMNPNELFPESAFKNKKFGWLNDIPESQWKEEFRKLYGRDISHILDQENLNPAIMINGELTDGFARVHLSHGLGVKVPIAKFKGEK